MKDLIRRGVVPIALLCLLATACGRTVTPVSAERPIVSVGVIGSLQSDPGASTVRGVQIAISEYNAKADSSFHARLVRADADGKKVTVQTASEGLLKTERIIGVLGALPPKEGAEVGAALQGASIPFFVPHEQSLRIPLDGWSGFRRLIANHRLEGSQLAAQLSRGSRGAAFLVHSSDEEGSAFAEGAKARLDSLSRPIVKLEALGSKPNFEALSASIIASGAGLTLVGGDGQAARSLGVALKKAGYKGVLGFSHQVRAVRSSSSEVPEQSITSSPAADKADPALRDFRETHRRRFAVDVSPFTLESYEGTLMLLEAVQEVEAKPREISEFLKLNRRFLGDSKDYEFDDKGELVSPSIWLYEARGNWRYARRSSPS